SYTDEPDNFIPLSVDRVKEVMELNKNGARPPELLIKAIAKVVEKKPDYENVVGQDSLTRFDKKKKQNNRNNKKRNSRPNPNKQNPNPNNQNKPNNNNNNRRNNNRPRPN
ncbi:MAG: hypothetical protein ACT4ON_00405, partial [Bacteroidota bacterium]